jgi:predicted lactoylglutathione lyase
MAIPQRLNFVTLGARSVARVRDFYKEWGWVESDGGSDDYASFAAGSVRLAIYPMGRLAEEAAPGEECSEDRGWNGVTLAINFATREEVDAAVQDAITAGATLVQQGTERDWGGYSAYVADPEGARWELAWAPGFDPEAAC